jgi:hypothetical protein
LSDLVQSVNAGGKTTVETEDLAFNDGSQGEIVKKLSEHLPHVGVAVLPQTFIIEAVADKKITNL